MSKRITVLILIFTFLPAINAQNPSADWVMLFKYRILIEAISKDGSGFVAVTESEEGKNKSVIIHLISSERKMIFKKTISFDGDLFEAEEIYIHDNAKLSSRLTASADRARLGSWTASAEIRSGALR